MKFLVDFSIKEAGKPLLADCLSESDITSFLMDGYTLLCGEKPKVMFGEKCYYVTKEGYIAVSDVEKIREIKLNELKYNYLDSRDKRRYLIIDGITYGFDCSPEDIASFSAAYAIATMKGSAQYKAYNEGEKITLTMSKEYIEYVFTEINRAQWALNDWYKYTKNRIESTDTIKGLDKIPVEYIEGDLNG